MIQFLLHRSEVLDRGVKQLISQALESKAKAFQTRIEGVVQNYIYTQKHPQNQDKQTRKRKTVDEKEETKPSTSEVISDISQLIPVPCTAGTVAMETTNPYNGPKIVPLFLGESHDHKFFYTVLCIKTDKTV